MSRTNIERIDDKLLKETYLFCYKRLGSSHDAEDLTQDILLEAIKAIRDGRTIGNFYSWFWAMAKNRLRMFFRLKQVRAVALENVENFLPSGDEVDDELIKSEETAELNHSISRLSRLHREVIILYYLRNMKTAEIAQALGVPEGTVKSRLHDAKHRIREGVVHMPNNTGTASYAPAELKLWGGYQLPKYWDKITDLITKQIFVACAREPRTVRQIADEIGVAPVYFEEKLSYLLDNKFLKEPAKGKYLTDFIIYPCQVITTARQRWRRCILRLAGK